MSTSALGWRDEQLVDHRRRMRNGMVVSLAIHASVLALFAASPPTPMPMIPDSISVELIAGLPAAQPAAGPAPKAKAAPAPKPAPEPEPPPPAPEPPPPPVAKAPVQVLPEQTPGRIRKVEPEAKPEEPKVVAKVEPKPEPPPQRRRREPVKELSFEDAMAALEDELGSDEATDLLAPAPQRPAESEASTSAGAPEARAGVQISAEMQAWKVATVRRIRDRWPVLAEYRGRGLVTALEIELSATGKVKRVQIAGSSGDPFFDDHAIDAIKAVDPLPPPPRAGSTQFYFRSDEY